MLRTCTEEVRLAKFDVHLRIPVRIKFRDVEGASAEDAVRKVMADQSRMALAEKSVQREYGSGPIEHIEIDECSPTSATVDLVGDDEHENTVDFDFDREGEPYPFVHGGPPAACEAEKVAHAAAGTMIASDGDARADDPIAAVIRTIFGAIATNEIEGAIDDVNQAIETLTRARDAVAAINPA